MAFVTDWTENAKCRGINTNPFFDEYETKPEVAKNTDSFCLSCLVKNQCLYDGIKNQESGVRGAVYLNKGGYSKPFNKHKDRATASALQAQVTAFKQAVAMEEALD